MKLPPFTDVKKRVVEIEKLLPRIPFNVKPLPYKLNNLKGPEGRLEKLSRRMTALLKYERIEVYEHAMHEVRGQAERLITEAIRNGACHAPTMELADFWLKDKQMIHKLFKVLVPRYQNYRTSFTESYLLQDRIIMDKKTREGYYPLFLLELKGNPFPPMPKKLPPNSQSLTNILLREASKDYRKQKLQGDGVHTKTDAVLH